MCVLYHTLYNKADGVNVLEVLIFNKCVQLVYYLIKANVRASANVCVSHAVRKVRNECNQQLRAMQSEIKTCI
jgi:hypothetical protein